MVTAMQVLAGWGLIRSLTSTMGPALKGLGRPDFAPRVQMTKLVFIVLSIYPLSMTFGIIGTALSIVISSALSEQLRAFFLVKTIGCTYYEVIRALMGPIISTSFMLFVLYIITAIINPAPLSLPVMLMFILLGSLAYCISLFFIEKYSRIGFWNRLKRRLFI